MVKKISIQEFVKKLTQNPVIDVRSPGEFSHAHIPGAYSLPLFSDEERKVVGTIYKQQGRKQAIKAGLGYFGVKMKDIVEEAEKIVGKGQLAIGNEQWAISNRQKAMGNVQWAIDNMQNERIDKGNEVPNTTANLKEALPIANCLLIYCWRGGMRSAGVAWLLDLYGFDVYTLSGGYKAFRNWVLEQFEKDHQLNIVGGYTGSGKTKILRQLLKLKQPVIDLEAIANHKGSAFGGIGQPKQPSQEMFENLLSIHLEKVKNSREMQGSPAWIEDESQRIGILNIPHSFWNLMRTKPVYFIDIPFSERLDYIVEEYGGLDKYKLAEAITRIQKRLGPLETKTALAELQEGNTRECFRILLNYYDKLYYKGLHNRENIDRLLNKIPSSSVDKESITEKLLSCIPADT